MPISPIYTPTIKRRMLPFTQSVKDEGYRRLMLWLNNSERVDAMNSRHLAQCIGRMAESEHPWTMRYVVLNAAAKALAPELFD